CDLFLMPSVIYKKSVEGFGISFIEAGSYGKGSIGGKDGGQADAIEEELETYNPLIPNGSNWKATFMLEYDDEEERKKQLGLLLGVDRAVWLKVGEHDPIVPITNEDLERETETKTSSVHFMRFELTQEMIRDLKQGTSLSAGIDHDAYRYSLEPIPANIQEALIKDLD
ncbi:MAG: DUF3501 family protein, partial [Gammaproteobacteria bacterium]|nr:DUF3501 family protein [Gammaproteobacteria bacterium]